MKTVKWRVYWDYEKEEQWLNEMAANGLALTDYMLFRYAFSDCEKGEYIYRIELLDKRPSNKKSMEYIRFMEETGAEYVSSHVRWIYFRKKAAFGPFDIYSDIESKMRHYSRVAFWFGAAATVEFILALFEFFMWFSVHQHTNVGLYAGLMLMVLCVFLARMSLVYVRKINRLKKEKQLRE